MIGLDRRSRISARAALAALSFLVAASAAEAQWFPPVGAAPPREIAERLRAEGYVLRGPLQRRDTVYLADVVTSSGARQRLVLDAWSGEILQRFVTRDRFHGRGGYIVEGGEFDMPPPLGPPPARDFGSGGGFAYGGPPDARIPAAVGPVRPAPSEAHPGRLRPKPTVASPKPETARTAPATGLEAPAVGTSTTTSAPPSGANPAAPGASPPAAASASAAQPSTPATAGSAAPAAPTMAQEAKPAAQPAPVAKPTDKSKINDVPVNPLE